MKFSDIIGLSELKTKLVANVDSGRVSHAQMFIGADGSGVYPLALAYAGYLMCTDRRGGDACGECAECYKMSKMEHPDVHYVFPVNDAKSGSTDKPTSDKYIVQWRELVKQSGGYVDINQWYKAIGVENKQGLIRKEEANEIVRKMSLKSFEGRYKIVIIYKPEAMRDEASNSLLKLIEEPPAQTLFLFVSQAADRVIGTIRSRTQSVNVPMVGDEEIERELVVREGLSAEQAAKIAKSSQGNWGRALKIVKGEQDQEIYEIFVDLMRLCYLSDYLGIFDWVGRMSAEGREFQKRFCGVSLEVMRDCYMQGIGVGSLNFCLPEREVFVGKFAPYVNHLTMERFVEEYQLLLRDIVQNGNSKIVFTHFALTLCKIFAQAKIAMKK